MRWSTHTACLIALLLVSPKLTLAEEPPPSNPCDHGVIATVRVEGCTMKRCRQPDFHERLLQTAGLAPQMTMSQELITISQSRLQELGYFRDVQILCEPGVDEAVDVVVQVFPLMRLRKIIFHGNRQYYTTMLADRLAIQPGDELEPTHESTEEKLQRMEETLLRIYEEDGFGETTITTKLATVPPNQVDLHVHITEGSRKKIAHIDLQLIPRTLLEEPEEQQCPVIRPRHLRQWAGLSTGKPFTPRTIVDATRSLTKALRAIGYSGVRVEASFDAEDKTLHMHAMYESCHILRFFVRDTKRPGKIGFRPLEDQGLLDALAFGDSGVFDLTEAGLAQEEIRQYFENRGYLLADVTLQYESYNRYKGQVRSELSAPISNVAGMLAYFITLNGRREIRGIRLVGNNAVSTAEILREMDTKTYDFFGDLGAVLPDQVFLDLDKIRRFYATKGYQQVTFTGAIPQSIRSRDIKQDKKSLIYRYREEDNAFSVRILPNTEGVYLEIGIEEGEQSRLGKVVFNSGNVLQESQIRQLTGLGSSVPFYGPSVASSATRIVQYLGSLGYLDATVTIHCQGHNPDIPRNQCDLLTIQSETVDIELDVQEKEQTHVGAVFVNGPSRTVDSVLTLDFPTVNDPYNVEKVGKAVRRLKDLGVFSSVQVQPVKMAQHDDQVALVIHARESRAKFLDLAAGFETMSRSGDFPAWITSPLATSIALQDRSTTQFGRALGLQIPDILLTAELRYTDQNFLGRAKRFYLPFKYGLSATSWHRYAGFTPTYIDPRFFVRGLNFRVTPFAIYDRASTRLDMIELGTEFALSKELFPRLFGAIAYEFAGVKTRTPETQKHYSPFRLENKITPTLTLDMLDHPINPTRGGLLQTSLAYINAMDRGKMNNFIKWDITGKYFFSLRKFFTVGLTARYGASKSFNSAKLPDDERFTLGGNHGVRGFSDDGVVQYLPDKSLRLERLEDGTWAKPYGGDILLSGSAEIRFPLLRAISLYGAVFYDVGALAERVSEISAASFRSSVGAGIRFLLGGMIPIRLDYGVALDPRCRLVDAETGLCLEKEEFGTIHFGILYTF